MGARRKSPRRAAWGGCRADHRPPRRDRRLCAGRAVPPVLADQDRGHAGPACCSARASASGPEQDPGEFQLRPGASDFPVFFELGGRLVRHRAGGDGGRQRRRLRPLAVLVSGQVRRLFFLLLTQIFPLVMLIAPIYRLMTPLGLVDSLPGPAPRLYCLQRAVRDLPDAVLLRRRPQGLKESAMIDGCTRFQALRRVVVPLTLPGMAATFGFVFTAAWSELLFALMLIYCENKMTSPVGFLTFVSKFSVDWGQMTAAGVLALIPACIFFALIQRYLVQGLTAGAVKG